MHSTYNKGMQILIHEYIIWGANWLFIHSRYLLYTGCIAYVRDLFSL